MNTITIPKEMIQKNDDLILMPRKEYEALSRSRVMAPIVKMTPKEKREWEQAKKDYRAGKFVTLETLEHELGITYSRKG